MRKLFVYLLVAMLAVPAIDLMSKPDTEKDKAAKATKTTATVSDNTATTGKTVKLSAAELEKRKPKKVNTLKSDKRTLKRKFVYRKGARQA